MEETFSSNLYLWHQFAEQILSSQRVQRLNYNQALWNCHEVLINGVSVSKIYFKLIMFIIIKIYNKAQ